VLKQLVGTIMIGALAAATTPGAAQVAQAQIKLKVMVFPGLSNFSIFAAEHKNLFAKHGLAIELINTPNSDALRSGLAKGEFQIAHAGVDNAVAMVELAKADVVIVAGGDNGFNRIFVQPEINGYADLRGKTVVVDAPNTAFALLLYKVLKDNGLNKGDYAVKPVGGTPARLEAMTKDKANAAAGILSPPFSFRAAAAGLKDMGAAAKAIGAYQSDGAFVMRDWGNANSDTLVRYIQAYVEGRRWALDPANKADAIKLLSDRLKLAPDVAAQAYAVATDPAEGMAKDAKLDAAGFNNVLKLRAEIEGQWGGTPPPPDKYLDLSYYAKALEGL
jgi:ABC-type nitrate/sulfonate/bicarbonate transport system substrate-binding protein